MPITTFQNILSTDKLQSGFRAKFNANVALLITDITDNGDGTATVTLQGGTNFQIDLGTSFYTKTQVEALITAVDAAVWGGITGNVADQTDVVGNFGVIDDIDNVLISCNLAVASGDADNPFGAFPASGYSSFSVPGIAGTGWQLLIKEGDDTIIKFRLYYGGAWGGWINIASSTGGLEVTAEVGDTNPMQVMASALTDAGITSLRPKVTSTIPLYGDETIADTTEGTVSRVDYFFTDSSKETLDYILLWGNMGDPDEFGEDTTFVIS